VWPLVGLHLTFVSFVNSSLLSFWKTSIRSRPFLHFSDVARRPFVRKCCGFVVSQYILPNNQWSIHTAIAYNILLQPPMYLFTVMSTEIRIYFAVFCQLKFHQSLIDEQHEQWSIWCQALRDIQSYFFLRDFISCKRRDYCKHPVPFRSLVVMVAVKSLL